MLNIKGIRLATQSNLKIESQENIPIKAIQLNVDCVKKLRIHLTNCGFNHQFPVKLFGKVVKGSAVVDFINIPYYVTTFGSQIVPQQQIYNDIEKLYETVLKEQFGLSLIGMGFVSFYK